MGGRVASSGLRCARCGPRGSRRAARRACERPDGLLGDGFPALAAMGAGAARRDGEDAVEEQHALLAPGREVAVGRRRVAEIFGVFLEDVQQARRERPDVGRDAEAQPDRVARRRVRILADDEDADVGERLLQRREDRVAGAGSRPAARSARRKSPSCAITSATGASASAQPGPTLSARLRVEASAVLTPAIVGCPGAGASAGLRAA